MFKNLKISHKLILSFSICVMFLFITGILGIMSINKINDRSTIIYEYNFKSVEKILEIKDCFIEIRANMEALVNVENKDNIANYENRTNELSSEYIKLMKEYETIITGHEEKLAPYQKSIKNNIINYKGIRSEIIQLIKNGEYDKAIELYNGEYKQLYSIIEVGVAEIVEQNVDEARVKNENINKLYKNSCTFILIIMIMGATISVLSALVIVKNIIIKIGRVLDFSKKLGDGDLTYEIEISSNDELDVMGKSLNKATLRVRELISEIMNDMQEMIASNEELSATVEEVTATMSNIQNSTNGIVKEISLIAETIGEIARRNNLLSLNAPIGSARAGEADKGFAVLATEIRNLSEQSAKTVDEISSIVSKVQEDIDDLVLNANDILLFIDNEPHTTT